MRLVKQSIHFLCRCIMGLCVVLATGAAFAYTEHPGGTINTDETWGAGTHCVTGNVTVSAGVILTIQPGAVVKFENGTELRIYGSLNAQGAAPGDIVITARSDDSVGEIMAGSTGIPENGDWDGIFLYGYGNNQGIGAFEYCQIRYGGYTGGSVAGNVRFYCSDSGYFKNSISEFSALAGLLVTNCSPQISDSRIRNNSGNGLYATDSGAPVLTGNTFTDNSGYGVYLDTSMVPAVAHDNTGSGNDVDGFVLFGTVDRDQTWWPFGSPDFPIVIMSTMTVNSEITLAISAGTVIKCNTGVALRINGKLDVNGTADQQVVFTSLKDDTFGGETHADENAAAPSPGDWQGVYLYGYNNYQGIGEFDHCRIRYGGHTGGSVAGNVYFYYSDSGYFRNSSSEFSALDGIRMHWASPQIDDSQIRNNNRYGLYADGSGGPVLTGNTFTDNLDYAVYMNTASVPAIAHDNAGGGNAVDGFVLFGTVDRDQTWWPFGSPDFPIVIMSAMTVNSEITLTVSAGTVIKCDTAAELRVYGKFDVNGTADQQVVFTSLKDDTFGGDTHADGNASAPSPGDWRGIFLYGYGNNQGIGEFDHCRIRYGGHTGGSAAGNVYFYYSDSGHFRNSISEFSAQDGIRVADVSPAVINANVVGNDRYGLYCYNSASLILNSIFWNNASEQIFSNTGDQLQVDCSDIQDGYPGDGNIDADPLFVDLSQGDYHLRQCSPCTDKGDPVETLVADYTAGNLIIAVDHVTHVEPGDLLWIAAGINLESGVVAGASPTSIVLENGFLNDYRVADGAHVFTDKSDYTHEPAPNGHRINMGVYGGSPFAAGCPCDGDLEPDGDVDGKDLSVFMTDFNRTDCMAAGDCGGDFDSDGDVDMDDLQAIADNFGSPDCHNQSGE